MKQIFFVLTFLVAFGAVAQMPDTTHTPRSWYGPAIWSLYDSTAHTWDTVGIFPGANSEIWSSTGLNIKAPDLIIDSGLTVKRATAMTYDTRLFYNMINVKTVQNTTTPTSLFNDTNAIGTRTIPAYFLKAGTTIRIRMRGDISNTGNPPNKMDIMLGGSTISSTGATLGTSLSHSIAGIEIDIVIQSTGTNGTCVAAGYTYVVSGITRSLLGATPITINTNTALAVDVIYTWGTANAANILKMITGTIEILY